MTREKKNILHLTDHLTGKADGVFTFLIILLKNLDNYNHYFGHHGDDFLESEFKRFNAKTVSFANLKKKFSIKVFSEVFSYIKKNNIDIIHCHYLKSYIIASFCNIILKRKVIYNYHGLFIDNEYYSPLEKLIYRFAHFIAAKLNGVQLAISPSLEGKKHLLSETKLFPEIKTYYSCSSRTSKEIEKADDKLIEMIKKDVSFKIAVPARLSSEKRIDLVLNITRLLADSGYKVKVYIIGDGELTNSLKQLAVDLEVHNYCYFLGYIRNPFYYLNLFDVMLITSDREGLPMSIFEAMESGLPVISTNVGGISEVIIDNYNGLLFPKNDAEAGFNKIKMVIDDYNLLKLLSDNSKKLYDEKFSCKKMTEQLNKIYRELLNA